MKAGRKSVGRGVLGAAMGAMACFAAPAALAAEPSVASMMAELDAQKKQLRTQQDLIDRAQAQIANQQAEIEATRASLSSLKAQSDAQLSGVTARGDAAAPGDVQVINRVAAPEGPVGEAPPPKQISEAVLPQGVNILTRPGHFVFDTALSYVQSSNNLLVFRGIEIVPGVEVGLIDANNTDRNQTVAMETIRFGVAPRFEVEAVIPYVYGNDRVTEAVQRDSQVTQTSFLRGSGLGDVEFTGRYQITSGRDGAPIVVGSLRVKPPTGRGPFDLSYDEFGAALNLPTGSGFWGVEPSVSALFTSDPAVIYATVGYLYNFDETVGKTIGGALLGKVKPGGAIDASFGFALALNQRFSFSLGFKDSYLFGTTEYLNGSPQRSRSLQVGSLLLGTSYRFSDRFTLAGNFEFGVTADAPNLTLTIHMPIGL